MGAWSCTWNGGPGLILRMNLTDHQVGNTLSSPRSRNEQETLSTVHAQARGVLFPIHSWGHWNGKSASKPVSQE